jgi:hypothetical protein
MITVTLQRATRIVTEHTISEGAFTKWSESKGAKPIDGSCDDIFKLISREITYEKIIAKDDAGQIVQM